MLCHRDTVSTDVGDLSGQPRTVPVQSSCASNVIFPHIPVWAANHETNWAISFEHDRQFFPLASLKINKIKNFSVFPPPSISFWYYCRRRCWELQSCKGGVKHVVIDPPLHPLCFLRQLGSLFPPQCFEFPPATRKKKQSFLLFWVGNGRCASFVAFYRDPINTLVCNFPTAITLCTQYLLQNW